MSNLERPARDRVEMNRIMRRPHMAEYDESFNRANKRTEKSLDLQHRWTDVVIKTQMQDHTRKQREFASEMSDRLTSRRKSATPLWQKVHNKRLSLPNLVPSNPANPPKPQRRRSSVATLMSEQGRVLKIRHRLYHEFKVGEQTASHHRPWSPTQTIIPETEEKKATPHPPRRVSEPAIKLTDKLSGDMECRLQAILEGLRTMSARSDKSTNLDLVEKLNKPHENQAYQSQQEPHETSPLESDELFIDGLPARRTPVRARRHSNVIQPNFAAGGKKVSDKTRRFSEGGNVPRSIKVQSLEQVPE